MDNLQQLGPTFVKLGQIMSIRCVPSLLPRRGVNLSCTMPRSICLHMARDIHSMMYPSKQNSYRRITRVAQEIWCMHSSVTALTRCCNPAGAGCQPDALQPVVMAGLNT